MADLARAMRVYAEQLTKGDIKPKAEDIIETKDIRAYCDSA